MTLGLSTLNWNISGAFSNPKDYHLPTQGLTHGYPQLKIALPLFWHGRGNKSTVTAQSLRASHATVVWDIALFFFLISDHYLDYFSPLYDLLFYE